MATPGVRGASYPESGKNFELRDRVNQFLSEQTVLLGHDKEDLACSLSVYFNKIHLHIRVPDVPIATIKPYAFFLLYRGRARIWLEKEPPRSIQLGRSSGGNFFGQMPSRMFKNHRWSKSKFVNTTAKARCWPRQEEPSFCSAPSPAPVKQLS
ncbi:reverse transcriptase domain-containing protein [Tanacetum coccineum]